MRRYDVIAEICDYMLELGWEPYQNDHEDANGQFEMNWKYDDALQTADKHSLLQVHGEVGRREARPARDLHAEAVPGPDRQSAAMPISRSGTRTARPTCSPTTAKELGLSDQGRNFLGGIMKHAAALAAITNPTVNSYKRINAPRTVSGATWAPNTVTWTGNNRTHMVRVPGPGRFELRLPDGAANPYLLQAVIIAAGLDGVRTKADPGKRYDIDMYSEGHTVKDAPKLPLNLLDALREFDKDKTLKAALGEEFSAAYLKLKNKEWNDYASPLHGVGARQHARHLTTGMIPKRGNRFSDKIMRRNETAGSKQRL